jgi:hypothetical protein
MKSDKLQFVDDAGDRTFWETNDKLKFVGR